MIQKRGPGNHMCFFSQTCFSKPQWVPVGSLHSANFWLFLGADFLKCVGIVRCFSAWSTYLDVFKYLDYVLVFSWQFSCFSHEIQSSKQAQTMMIQMTHTAVRLRSRARQMQTFSFVVSDESCHILQSEIVFWDRVPFPVRIVPIPWEVSASNPRGRSEASRASRGTGCTERLRILLLGGEEPEALPAADKIVISMRKKLPCFKSNSI